MSRALLGLVVIGAIILYYYYYIAPKAKAASGDPAAAPAAEPASAAAPAGVAPPTTTGTTRTVGRLEIVRTDNRDEAVHVARLELWGAARVPATGGAITPVFGPNLDWQNVNDGNRLTFGSTTSTRTGRIVLTYGPGAAGNRVVVANRLDACCGARLEGCELQVYDNTGKLIHRHRFGSATAGQEWTINLP
jgi:hypothetical protein